MKAGDIFSHFVFYYPLKDLNFYLKCFHYWCVFVYLPRTRTLHLLSFSAQFFSSQPCPHHPTPYPCGSVCAHKEKLNITWEFEQFFYRTHEQTVPPPVTPGAAVFYKTPGVPQPQQQNLIWGFHHLNERREENEIAVFVLLFALCKKNLHTKIIILFFY